MFPHLKHDELDLLLDIQSGLVRGALVQYKKGEKPHLIYIISKNIQFKSNVDSAYFTKMMIKAVEEVASLVLKEGFERARGLGLHHPHLHTVHYILSSPWIISESKTIKVEFPEAREITESLVESILKKEHESLIQKYKTEGKGEHDLTFIEQKIFDIRLNGYSVENYKGKKVQKVEISFAVTLSTNHILERIRNSVRKIIHSEKEVHHSALLLHYLSLRSLIPNHEEYISLHAHGELTDIVIVKEGISSYFSSFPFGTTTLIRKIAEAANLSEETSDSLLSIYEDGKLEETEKIKIEKVITSLILSWQSECIKTLFAVGEKSLLPRLIYLSVHSHYKIFKDALQGTQFEVLAFDDSVIDTVIKYEKKSERSPLMGMYALALKSVL